MNKKLAFPKYDCYLITSLILIAGLFSISCTSDSGNNSQVAQPSNEIPPAIIPDSVGLRLVAEGLVSPVGLIPTPDGSGRLFVVDQIGIIRVLKPGGALSTEPFLDLRPRMIGLNASYDERGLLGLAFHPEYRDNGRFFVYYSAPLRSGGPSGWNHTSHLSEFKVLEGNPEKADEASERIIFQVDQPQSNHNGGQICFGPDGFLYIPLGDGGGANDTGNGHSLIGNGQDINNLLGKILRIDVDSVQPYGIPRDNPFIGEEGADEIFAFGLRNPFQISFDMGGTRELFAADAGQNLWEEVDIIIKGGNYGWNIKEGDACFDPANPGRSKQSCPDRDISGRQLIDPIVSYAHSGQGITGTAAIGGFVYRGNTIPGLQGVYVFGDFSSGGTGGTLLAALRNPSGDWSLKELNINTSANARLNTLLRSFGQDASGEIYLLTAENSGPSGSTGKIFKIIP
jgi:glucose/arabinose dehydrogenase